MNPERLPIYACSLCPKKTVAKLVGHHLVEKHFINGFTTKNGHLIPLKNQSTRMQVSYIIESNLTKEQLNQIFADFNWMSPEFSRMIKVVAVETTWIRPG